VNTTKRSSVSSNGFGARPPGIMRLDSGHHSFSWRLGDAVVVPVCERRHNLDEYQLLSSVFNQNLVAQPLGLSGIDAL